MRLKWILIIGNYTAMLVNKCYRKIFSCVSMKILTETQEKGKWCEFNTVFTTKQPFIANQCMLLQ